MKKALLVLVPVLVMALAAIGFSAGEKLETVTLEVKGMTCQGCANKVDKELRGVDGVSEVEVSFEDASATISYDPTKTTKESLVETIKAAGFACKGKTAKECMRGKMGKKSGCPGMKGKPPESGAEGQDAPKPDISKGT